MADLPVSAQSTAQPSKESTAQLVPNAVEAAGSDYARAAEQARQIAMGWRDQTAQQQGNAV